MVQPLRKGEEALCGAFRTTRPWHPLLRPATLTSSNSCIESWELHGACQPSLLLHKVTHRETSFRLRPTGGAFQRSRRVSMPQPPYPCLKVTPSSTQHLTRIQEAQGTKIQIPESHCLAPQPHCPF